MKFGIPHLLLIGGIATVSLAAFGSSSRPMREPEPTPETIFMNIQAEDSEAISIPSAGIELMELAPRVVSIPPVHIKAPTTHKTSTKAQAELDKEISDQIECKGIWRDTANGGSVRTCELPGADETLTVPVHRHGKLR